jgi:hypothetical protein
MGTAIEALCTTRLAQSEYENLNSTMAATYKRTIHLMNVDESPGTTRPSFIAAGKSPA